MAWLHPPAIGCRFSFLHLPCGRCGHTMIDSEDSLILFGGFNGRKWLNDVHFFDKETLVWNQRVLRGQPPEPRQYHSACKQRQSLLIFGGYNGHTWLNDLVRLDLGTLSWHNVQSIGDVPSPREGHSMAEVSGQIYVFGGWDGSALNDLYLLKKNFWTKINVSGPSLCGHSMTPLGNSLIVFGGFDGRDWSNKLFKLDHDLKWNTLNTSGFSLNRGYHSAALVKKYILIYGGYNGQCIMGDLMALDTENLTWSVPDPCSGYFPPARNAHSMTLVGSELYIFGGYSGFRDTNDLHVLETAAFSSLHSDFLQGYREERWKDVRLVCMTGYRTVHSVILQTRAPVLYKMLREKNPYFLQNRHNFVHLLEIPTTSISTLNLFCEYLYSDLSRDQIPNRIKDDLLFLAVRFNLPRLINLCLSTGNDQNLPDSTLALDIMKSKSDTELSDLTISINGELFQTHKSILAARCPYFEAMFKSGMQETCSSMLDLDTIDPKAFETILEWIYSDKFSPLFSESDLLLEDGVQLLVAANFLQLKSVSRMTEIALEKILKLENAVHLFEVSHVLNAEKLRAYCINCILREFDKLSVRKEFVLMRADAFNHLLKYLPQKMKRQASSFASLKTEVSMVKWEHKNTAKTKQPVMILGETLQNKDTEGQKPRVKNSKRICIKAKREELKLDKNFILTGRAHSNALNNSKSLVFGLNHNLFKSSGSRSTRKLIRRL